MSPDASHRRTPHGPVALLAGLLVLTLLLPGTSAHVEHGMETEHGHAEIMLDSSADPCQVTLSVTQADHQNGTATLNQHIGGLPPDSERGQEAFVGEADGAGTFQSTTGPFNISAGLEYYFTVNYDTPELHSFSSNIFTVDACPGGDLHIEGSCPPVDLSVVANPDESVTITATIDNLSGEATLTRSSGDGEPNEVHVATLEEGTNVIVDAETEAGTTYTYEVAIDDRTCIGRHVTAIPVFPTLLAGALASIAAIGAYAMTRRRP